MQLVFIAYIKSTSAAVHCKWQALCCGGRCLRLRLTCVWLLHSGLLPRILQFGARLLRFLTLFFFFCRASDITGRTSEPRGQEGKGIESGSLFVSLASSDMRRFWGWPQVVYCSLRLCSLSACESFSQSYSINSSDLVCDSCIRGMCVIDHFKF